MDEFPVLAVCGPIPVTVANANRDFLYPPVSLLSLWKQSMILIKSAGGDRKGLLHRALM